jgi:PAS domain S-box-containing protein
MAEAENISDELQQRAFLYAAGNLDQAERDQFEALVERDSVLQEFTREALELATQWQLEKIEQGPKPAKEVNERLLCSIDMALGVDALLDQFATEEHDSVVLTDSNGCVQWVSRSFTLMCGYVLDELRGRRLGAVLQGPKTDQAAVERMRHAIRQAEWCSEELINYHKNGRPYRVAISINPIVDSSGSPRGYLAIERELVGAS